MLRKSIYIKKNRVTISLFLVITGITMILTSELSRYAGLSESAILSGIQKTMVYAMIIVGFCLHVQKGIQGWKILGKYC